MATFYWHGGNYTLDVEDTSNYSITNGDNDSPPSPPGSGDIVFLSSSYESNALEIGTSYADWSGVFYFGGSNIHGDVYLDVNTYGGEIYGGNFYGTVTVVSNNPVYSMISDGVFFNTVYNYGLIGGGVFYNNVYVSKTNSYTPIINGGNFYKYVSLSETSVSGSPSFLDLVEAESTSINAGLFYNTLSILSSVSIANVTFKKGSILSIPNSSGILNWSSNNIFELYSIVRIGSEELYHITAAPAA